MPPAERLLLILLADAWLCAHGVNQPTPGTVEALRKARQAMDDEAFKLAEEAERDAKCLERELLLRLAAVMVDVLGNGFGDNKRMKAARLSIGYRLAELEGRWENNAKGNDA